MQSIKDMVFEGKAWYVEYEEAFQEQAAEILKAGGIRDFSSEHDIKVRHAGMSSKSPNFAVKYKNNKGVNMSYTFCLPSPPSAPPTIGSNSNTPNKVANEIINKTKKLPRLRYDRLGNILNN